MPLKTVRLELARCHEFPQGSSTHGYEFIAPLDGKSYFDPVEWKLVHANCKVRRFWGNAAEERGLLEHTKGRHWVFSYVPKTTEDDEPIFRLDRHSFIKGEYISITEHDGIQRTFRVVDVH